MTTKEGILLRALDGSNPLAFLAALGAFRLLSLETPDANVQMCWERADGAWRPRLLGIVANEEELCRILHESAHWAPAKEFIQSLGKNIKVPKETFKPFIKASYATAELNTRVSADFAAAFGCEVCEEEKKAGDERNIEYTDLCFITGSGHQHFLGTIGGKYKLADKVTYGHISDALFGNWRREKAKGMSMRWDPADAAEYALQWENPSGEGAWAVWGANRLAFEALPLFPTAPFKDGLRTTGFKRRNGQDEFTWPIWNDFLGLASARSLLALAELQEIQPPRNLLCARGVNEVYRAQRVRIGQGANFKVSFRPARTA